MRRRYLLILLLFFVVSPAIAYTAAEFLSPIGRNEHSIKAFVATKSITPTPTHTSMASKVVTNSIGGTCDDLLVLVDKTYGLPES